MEHIQEKIAAATKEIQSSIRTRPTVGLILGSGLGVLADEIEDVVTIQYKDIPHFPVSTVEGHAGKLVIGTLEGKQVVAMQGRFHYYEGYSMQEVTFPVRVMQQLGVSTVVVTNACGGMNDKFKPGDLMLIKDHLNLTGDNPLIGPNLKELGPRFPDMSQAYTPRLQELARNAAKKLDISLQEGIYAGITGPNYMTPAELIMIRNFGADAVGMSTIPEVIVARHMNLNVLGISCVTDMALGESLEPLTHEQVVEVANKAKPKFINLVKEFLAALPE